MELETMKATWAEYDRKLDRSIRLNERVLLNLQIGRVRWPLRRFALLMGTGAMVLALMAATLGQFLYANWAEARFAAPAALLDAWVIAMLSASVRQFLMAVRIDYDQPVAGIQRQIEALRIVRTRVVQWAVLSGQFVWWMPFVIVAVKGWLGVDAYELLGMPFVLSNVVAGLAVIPLALWAARRFGARWSESPVLRELAGYNLNAAASRLVMISAFETETV